MDLTRTLAVVIDPRGAQTGGAAAATAFRQVGKAAKETETNTKQATGALTGMTASVNPLTSALTGLKAAFAGASVLAFARDLLNTEIAVQRSANAMRYASGSVAELAKNQQFIRGVTAGLGMDLLSTSASFAKLAASAKGTSMEGTGIRNLFLATAKGATAMGLSVDETSGALNAFSQMLSKGTVAAEELRGQLGERLYGAFNMAAKSMGMTTQEMNKMLMEGKILATDLLPALTLEMYKAFSADAVANAHSLQAEVNRLATAALDFKTSLMDSGVRDFFTSLIGDARSLLGILRQIIAAEKNLAGGVEAAADGNGAGVVNAYKNAVKMMIGAENASDAKSVIKQLFGGQFKAALGTTTGAAKRWAGGSEGGSSLKLEAASSDVAEKLRVEAARTAAAAHGYDLLSLSQAQYAEEIAKSARGLTQVKDIGLALDGMQVFAFDKTKIDAAANGMESYAETVGKVNKKLSEFFGEMDDSSKVNQDTGLADNKAINSSLDDFFGSLDEKSGTMTTQRRGRRGGDQPKQLTTGSFFRDMANSAKLATQDMQNMFEQSKLAGEDVAHTLSSGFTEFFDGIVDGTGRSMRAFTSMTASILRDIAKIILQRSIAEPIASAVMSSFSGMFGGAPSGSASGSLFHTGGFVGLTMGPQKLVDPSLFNRAPRLHSGLKPDEFPAILQRGEEVVPRNQVGRRGVSVSIPINVTVDGSKGGSREQNQQMGQQIGEQIKDVVRAVLVEELAPRGLLNQA